MSYDLTIIEKRAEEDWESALERAGEGSFGQLAEERRQIWKTAEERISALDPDFEVHPGSGEVLNDSFGMIVSFSETQVDISIAYWHQGDDAHQAMKTVAGVVDVIRDVSGWAVWDPQLGRELSSGAELIDGGTSTMGDISGRLPGLVASTAAAKDTSTSRVPWWKFWAKKPV